MTSVDSNKYIITDKIGNGAFGCAYKCINRNNHIFVIKQVNYSEYPSMENKKGCENYETTMKEIEFLKLFSGKHPNIIKFYEYLHDSQNKIIDIVLEFNGTSLKKYCDKYNPNFTQQIDIIKQISSGVEYIHSHCIIHLDLKPSNITVLDGCVKLIDFGHSLKIDEIDMKDIHQTLWYRSPEILLGTDKFDYSVDMWSLGCIIYELYGENPLFPGDSEIDQMMRIFRYLGTPNEEIFPRVSTFKYWRSSFPCWDKCTTRFSKMKQPFKDLLENLIVYNPENRFTASQIRELLV